MSRTGVLTRVDEVLERSALTTVFQPIVDLVSGEVVAHEALTRGPEGPLERPDALFAAARREDLLPELDRLARVSALRRAMAAGEHGPRTLFVNIEPDGIPLDAAPPEYAEFAGRGGQIVMEFTERALTEDPARVLWFANRLRRQGIALALDDVGSHPASLAVLPFVRPEVVKLDMSLVQHPVDDEAALVVTSVGSYAERRDAVVLAEGIETSAHESSARALGATLGQGWHLGRPGPLGPDPRRRTTAGWSVTPRQPVVSRPSSPWARVTGRDRGPRVRRGGVGEVETAVRVLEKQALAAEISTVLLGSAGPFGGPSARRLQRYARAARLLPFVGLLGLDHEAPPAVRGAPVEPGDPLRDEWAVAVVGARTAVALVARRPEHPAAQDRLLDYAVTHDRDLALAVAHSLLDRIVPAPTLGPPTR